MSSTNNLSNSSYYYNSNTLLHPLETTAGAFIERKPSFHRRPSVSSDMSDQEPSEPIKRTSSINDWDQLLSQFDSQPDMIQLIQLCKAEEERRRQEESKMKMKEYQVLRQLQQLQGRNSVESKISQKELDIQLPALSHE